MRLVKTLNDQQKARRLAAFLGAEGIENQLEITSNNDWGSDHYGEMTCRLWIINEDAVERAGKLIDTFEQNPSDPRYDVAVVKIAPEKESNRSRAVHPDEIMGAQGKSEAKQKPKGRLEVRDAAISTNFYIIMMCCLLFLVDVMSSPSVTTIDKKLPIIPQVASPLKKECLFDYPEAYTLTDHLIEDFGQAKLKSPQDLPKDGQELYKKILNTPYWHGYYPEIQQAWNPTAESKTKLIEAKPQLFEKIRQGEVWRAFSPCLIHYDILHLLFNMLWLVVLGQQIEFRVGPRRYIAFSIIVGVVSNTFQYLMGGTDFFGYSGVVTGMLGFIWVRQKVAAWEGYPLQKSTINFLLFFVVTMMLVQFVSFYLEMYHGFSISPGLANTSHVVGAITGVLLGLTPFFSWKS